MKLTDLRGILQYIPQFREKTFIISVDGAIVTDENFANILLDVAVLRSLNIRVVLVHGASAQIKALAAEQGITPSNLDGTGVTDDATLKLALTAANRLTHEILEGLSANDLRAACTNAIIAHPLGHPARRGSSVHRQGRARGRRDAPETARPGHRPGPAAARLRRRRQDLSRQLRRRRPGGGRGAQGHQADVHHHARRHPVGDHVIRQMLVADLESVLALQKTDVHPDMLSKAIHAAAACKAGVPRVHVINGSRRGRAARRGVHQRRRRHADLRATNTSRSAAR